MSSHATDRPDAIPHAMVTALSNAGQAPVVLHAMPTPIQTQAWGGFVVAFGDLRDAGSSPSEATGMVGVGHERMASSLPDISKDTGNLRGVAAVDAGPTVAMALGTSAAGMPDRGGQAPDPAAIARQVARALGDPSRDPGVPLDLTLDPPELGRLRLGFAEINGVLTVTIAAERSDTAELIRRHVALLAEEFARAGLDAPSVNISHGGAEQRSRGGSVILAGSDTDAASIPDAPAPSAPVRRTGAAGLDLRL